MKKIPKTWLSTQFSAPAKETEGRLRNLFQGLGKRPPALVLAALVLAAGLCGNLVSCQGGAGERNPGAAQGNPTPTSTPSPAPTPAGELPTQAPEQTGGEGTDAPQRNTDAATIVSTATMCQIEGWMEGSGDRGSEELVYWEGAGKALVAYHFYWGSRSVLSLGVVDLATMKLDGELFFRERENATANVACWETADGGLKLVYTFNSDTQGEGGCLSFDGTLRWEWPVEGEVTETPGPGYEDLWAEHKALLAPGGVAVFGKAGTDPVRWLPENYRTFYPCEEDGLPIGVLWKVRGWLEEWTEFQALASSSVVNPPDMSAYWRILSVRPDGAGQEAGTTVYHVVCQADREPNKTLFFNLTMDEDNTVVDWSRGLDDSRLGLAKVEKFPLSAFSQEVREKKDVILQQIADYEPYMSSIPRIWGGRYPTWGAAVDFVGLPQLLKLPLPVEMETSVGVEADWDGVIQEVSLAGFAMTEGDIGVQSFATMYTQYQEGEATANRYLGDWTGKEKRVYQTPGGVSWCWQDGGLTEDGRRGMEGAELVKDGVLYAYHTSFPLEGAQRAHELLEQWVSQFD